MAIKTSWIAILQDKVSANAKKIAKSITKMEKSFQRSDKAAQKANKSFSKFADKGIGKFKELAIAGAAFFGAKRFIETGAKFQTQIAELSAITGAAGKDLAFLSDEALRLSKVSVVSQEKVAEAFKLIASAKDELLENPKALSNVTEQVLLLANASKVDLTQAAEFVGQSLNQFGAGADQAARFVNVLAAGAKFGASEVEDTGAALLKVGVVARQAGLSFEETNGALQTLALVGLKTQIAGTGLSGVFVRLGRLGINFKKTGMTETFIKIREAIESTTSETEKANLLQKLFGAEHLKTGLTLVENAERIEEFTKKVTGTNTAQVQAAVNMRTFETQARRLGITIDDIMIKSFLKIEPVLSKVTASVGEFFESFNASDIEVITIAINGLLQVLKVVFELIKFISSAIGLIAKPVVAILKGLGTAIGQQLGAFATGDFFINSDNGTSIVDDYSLGGKFLGGFGLNDRATGLGLGEEKSLTSGQVGNEKSVLEVIMSIKGDTDSVKSVAAKSKGPISLPVKTNMAGV